MNENKTTRLRVLAIALGVLAFLITYEIVFSQDNPTKKSPEERASKVSEIFAKKLELSDEQKGSVYNVLLEQNQQLDKIRGNKDSYKDKDELRSAVKNVFSDSDSKMKTILSSDQYSKFGEMKKMMIKKIKQHRMKNKPPHIKKNINKG